MDALGEFRIVTVAGGVIDLRQVQGVLALPADRIQERDEAGGSGQQGPVYFPPGGVKGVRGIMAGSRGWLFDGFPCESMLVPISRVLIDFEQPLQFAGRIRIEARAYSPPWARRSHHAATHSGVVYLVRPLETTRSSPVVAAS